MILSPLPTQSILMDGEEVMGLTKKVRADKKAGSDAAF